MSVTSAFVFNPRLTFPLLDTSDNGLVALTLVMVPGNVCVGANVITPVWAMERTVGVSAPAPF